jgi:D-3-phosphoglycerate dehydrogenase
VKRLQEEGFEVETVNSALSDADLEARLRGYIGLGIRSKTQVKASALKNQKGLLALGAFCIGTNQVDLETANQMGIPVFNAPYSNTRSVAELVIAEMVALSRRLGDINMMAHRGEWMKSAQGAREVRGKTLGIIGYGHIGSQVSVLAESMGLRVMYYDVIKKLPMGNASVAESLEQLLRECDFVTLHVPETPLTKNMIGTAELKSMKPGAFLINASRGTVVDIPSLREALMSGHLGGAAIDVFPSEPENNKQKFESALQGLANVILTPHIGGSTEEAQEAIGREVAESLIRYLKVGQSLGAVNFPTVDVPPLQDAQRLVNVHKNVPGVLSEINSIVSKTGANIKAQYLSTDPHIGYLVMDMEKGDAEMVAQQVKTLPTSISTRVI